MTDDKIFRDTVWKHVAGRFISRDGLEERVRRNLMSLVESGVCVKQSLYQVQEDEIILTDTL